jgi:hypothetical protein
MEPPDPPEGLSRSRRSVCYVALPVTERTVSAPPLVSGQLRVSRARPRPRLLASLRPWAWPLVAVLVVAAAVGFVAITGMRPAFDAYGWLVWGRQAVHFNLDTNSAPSWKPLTFLFTFPYAAAGRGALWLWMVTAVSAAFAAPIFGGRVAYRLVGPAPGRRYAPIIAAIFAAAAVLGIAGYWHFILIATSDPLIVMLCLAAIDFHLSGRPRAAWAMLVLAALGRPEAWPLAALYWVWAWRSVRSMRIWLYAGAAVVPVLWFGIPALTAPSLTISSDIALQSTNALPGNKFSGTMDGFFSLYELPMQLATLFAVGFAIVRRDRAWLVLIGAAIVWLAVEVALALHGWQPAPRYMFEPAAVLVVLAGAAIGRVLAITPRRLLLRLLAFAALAGLIAALVPHARIRARLAHNGIKLGRTWALQIKRLHTVIAKDGGAKHILSCGQAVTTIPYQSILAWEIGQNMADVGWIPSEWIATGRPIVLFQPTVAGWQVRPIHIPAADRARCDRLTANTPVSLA